MNEIFVFSNTLYTPQGFKSDAHETESVSAVFLSGFDSGHSLRKYIPKFDLTYWDKTRFTSPQIGAVKIFGSNSLHRIQHVVVKIIYNKQSPLDPDSFDAIPSVFLYFERELPADIEAGIDPHTIIIGSEWKLVKLCTYESPLNLGKVITYDLSE